MSRHTSTAGYRPARLDLQLPASEAAWIHSEPVALQTSFVNLAGGHPTRRLPIHSLHSRTFRPITSI